jgi:hypothetical protein
MGFRNPYGLLHDIEHRVRIEEAERSEHNCNAIGIRSFGAGPCPNKPQVKPMAALCHSVSGDRGIKVTKQVTK